MTKHRLFWPVLMLVVLLGINVIFGHHFLRIEIKDGHLYGGLIDILQNGAPLVLVSLGMTLVIATGGIDLSVGSVVAISGALACYMISQDPDQNSVGAVVTAVALGVALSLVLGVWNGLLVARAGIQPIIATLVMLVAGRGIAQLITNGQIITINSSPYKMIGGGHLLGLPVQVWIAAAVFILAAVLTRRTALGLLLESVGGNAEASRLVGIKSRGLVVMVYIFAALCAGIAGLILSSNISAADGNKAGLWIELDAILAVVIGGTSLMGGRFYLGGTVIGAVLIQTLTTTIYSTDVPPETALVYKAIVVTIVCLIQSPAFRAKVFGWRRRRPGPPAEQPTPNEPTTVEVPV
jgi:ribose/xylose/arabinose/galactoside ABC-type transport system permease subunit